MLGILGGEGKQENKNEVQEMENYGAEAGSAVKLLEELLNLGYRKNASDIHLEPQEDRMVVRMRLDGMLLHVREYDKEMHQPLVTRAKVLSGMDIAKKRVPQDGHFKERRQVNWRKTWRMLLTITAMRQTTVPRDS